MNRRSAIIRHTSLTLQTQLVRAGDRAFAGIRRAEVCRLDWAEVNLDKGLIEIKRGKAKTISENLAPFLKGVAEAERSGRCGRSRSRSCST